MWHHPPPWSANQSTVVEPPMILRFLHLGTFMLMSQNDCPHNGVIILLNIFKQTKFSQTILAPKIFSILGRKSAGRFQLVRKSPRSSQSKNQSGLRLLLNLPEKNWNWKLKNHLFIGGDKFQHQHHPDLHILYFFWGGSFVDTFRQDSIRMARKAFKAVTKPGQNNTSPGRCERWWQNHHE